MSKFERYMKAHWLGMHPLWKSYWVNSCLIATVLSFAAAFTMGVFAGIFMGAFHISKPSDNTFELFGTIVAMPVYIWSIVGTWRSASNYTANTHDASLPWGGIAKFMIGLGLIITVLKLIGMIASQNVSVSV